MSRGDGRAPLVYVVISGDTRSMRRAIKGSEARLDDVVEAERAAHVRRITDPATVIRKALGEFS